MSEIDRNCLKNSRLNKFLSRDDLAKATCLLGRYIKRLEDGGTPAFFFNSPILICKKVASLRKISEWGAHLILIGYAAN